MVVCVIADDLDDRLEDDDFDLIEENLGVRVERVSHKGPYSQKWNNFSPGISLDFADLICCTFLLQASFTS